MRARLAVLAAVLGGGVVGLGGADKEPSPPSCPYRFNNQSTKALSGQKDDDPDEKFTCVSDILDGGSRLRTFVWILHNDKPSVVLYSRWDDADMPFVNDPISCRLVTTRTLNSTDPEAKKSHVVYGTKQKKTYDPQTYVMPEENAKGKDEGRESPPKKVDEQAGMALESRVVNAYESDADARTIDVSFITEVIEKNGTTFRYRVVNHSDKPVRFRVDDVTNFWNEEYISKNRYRVAVPWEVQKGMERFYWLPGTKKDKRELASDFQISAERPVTFVERRAKILIYPVDKPEADKPIAGGKITIYLPKEKD
jgi:hypothetical protein